MTDTNSDRIVLHVAGLDRPGVTSRLMEVIAAEHASLVDIGQTVLHGYLMLSAIVDIPLESRALRQILHAVGELGLRLEVSSFLGGEKAARDSRANGLCVTILGDLGNGKALAQLTQNFAARGMNIHVIRTLSDLALSGMELIVDLPPNMLERAPTPAQIAELRGEILGLAEALEVDLAVQRNDIYRRNKRLVCMDVDSTFVQGEFIDELAELAGCKEAVAAITARAMRGELDFRQALKERVALLEGLPLEKARSLCKSIKITPGADLFARTLKSLGFRVGLVSGGFDFFVDELKNRFGLDFAFANELELQDGRLTGRTHGTIVDAERKAQLLRDMSKVYECRLEQTVAIGDGANDIFMLQTAGLGVAYHGKPKLQEVADMRMNRQAPMDTLLLLMGFHARDLDDLHQGQPGIH
jgi:phosphoserine phosphatase